MVQDSGGPREADAGKVPTAQPTHGPPFITRLRKGIL